MTTLSSTGSLQRRLRCAVVLRVQEDTCLVLRDGATRSAGYAAPFPSPRTERVSPGHLVALATAPDGSEVVVWRWYDAVVLGAEDGGVRLWEPAHGEVVAQPRRARQEHHLGTRAYLSAGLPGAQWWVAGAAPATEAGADVELDEVERLYDEHGLWGSLGR